MYKQGFSRGHTRNHEAFIGTKQPYNGAIYDCEWEIYND